MRDFFCSPNLRSKASIFFFVSWHVPFKDPASISLSANATFMGGNYFMAGNARLCVRIKII